MLSEVLRVDDLDPAIVDAHLLLSGVLVDDHLLATHEYGAAHLRGREPRQLEMNEPATRVTHVDERNVHDPGHDRAARDGAPPAGRAEPVDHDREVVRREVADNRDVRLVDAQVHAARGAEEDLADLTSVEQVLDRVDGRRVDEGVARHEHEPALIRDLDELLGFLGGLRERLLDEDVLAGLEAALGERVVGRDRGDDEDRVDRVVVDDRLDLSGQVDARVTPGLLGQSVRVLVTEGRDVNVLELERRAQDVRAPVSETDYRDVEFVLDHAPLPIIAFGVFARIFRSIPGPNSST